MNIERNILKNSGFIMLGNLIDVIFSLIIAVLLAKYYGKSGFGTISFLGLFFFLLGSIDSMWIRPIIIREISRDTNRAGIFLANGMIIRVVLSVFTLFLFWITIGIVGIPKEMVLLALFSSCNILLGSVIFSYETIFRSYLKMVYFLRSKLLGNILTVTLICLVVFLKGNLTHFFMVSLISSLVLFLLTRSYSQRLLEPVFKFDPELWKKVFSKGWFLGLSALFIFIYHRIDQIMLFRFYGSDVTGLYAAAVRLVEVLNFIPLALMSSLLPFMSLFAVDSKELFTKSYRLSFKYLLIFIIPVAAGTMVFSSTVVSFFYGPQYAAGGLALSILIWAEVFVFLGIVNNTILISANKQWLDPVFTGSSAIVNIILNFVLIPKFGLEGAAVASLIAYATGPIMGNFISTTRDYSRSMFYYSLKPVFASIAMLFLNWYFHFSLTVSLFFLPIIYLVTIYFLGGFDREDTRLFKAIFRSN